jgi:hypothetical protein
MIKSCPSCRHRVEHPAVRRMRDADRKINLVAINRAATSA